MIDIQIIPKSVPREKFYMTMRMMNARTIYLGRVCVTFRQPSLFTPVPNEYGGFDHEMTKYHKFLIKIGVR